MKQNNDRDYERAEDILIYLGNKHFEYLAGIKVSIESSRIRIGEKYNNSYLINVIRQEQIELLEILGKRIKEIVFIE